MTNDKNDKNAQPVEIDEAGLDSAVGGANNLKQISLAAHGKGSPAPGGANVLLGDGSVRTVTPPTR